jgi:hypothetical protein
MAKERPEFMSIEDVDITEDRLLVHIGLDEQGIAMKVNIDLVESLRQHNSAETFAGLCRAVDTAVKIFMDRLRGPIQ